MQADLNRAADVRRHRVTNHHGLAKLTVQSLTEFFARAVKHVGVRFPEVVGAPACAGLQKRGGRPRARSRFVRRNRTPVVRIGGDQPRAAFDEFVGLGQRKWFSR